MLKIRFGKAAGNIVGVIVIVWDVLAWITDSGFLGVVDFGLPEYGAIAAGLMVYFGWWNWETFRAHRPSQKFMLLAPLITKEMPPFDGGDPFSERHPLRMIQDRLYIAAELHRLKVPCPDPDDVEGWGAFSTTVGAFAKSGNLKFARRFAKTHFHTKVPELPRSLRYKGKQTRKTDPSAGE